ncbi:MAG: hypothetical protein WA194_07200 [Patescibacteria group bacterium]
MEKLIGNKTFVLVDQVLKKHVHSFVKTYEKREKGEIDDMDVSDEMLKAITVSIDGNTDPASFQTVLDNITPGEYQELVAAMNSIVTPDQKKSEISNTSTKPSSTGEADASLPNG